MPINYLNNYINNTNFFDNPINFQNNNNNQFNYINNISRNNNSQFNNNIYPIIRQESWICSFCNNPNNGGKNLYFI